MGSDSAFGEPFYIVEKPTDKSSKEINKMYICDLCGAEVSHKEGLIDLDIPYQRHDVRSVCTECFNEIRDFVAKADSVLDRIRYERKMKWYEKFLQKMIRVKRNKNEFPPPPPMPHKLVRGNYE